ncbi:MAG: hypothetical protein ABI345_11460 [Jatrophihabitans sp.]
MIDPTDRTEPIERSDNADPTDPIDSTDPIEPIESTDPLLPIHNIESWDLIDHLEPSSRVIVASWSTDRHREEDRCGRRENDDQPPRDFAAWRLYKRGRLALTAAKCWAPESTKASYPAPGTTAN